MKSEALTVGCDTSDIPRNREISTAVLLSIKLHPADSDEDI